MRKIIQVPRIANFSLRFAQEVLHQFNLPLTRNKSRSGNASIRNDHFKCRWSPIHQIAFLRQNNQVDRSMHDHINNDINININNYIKRGRERETKREREREKEKKRITKEGALILLLLCFDLKWRIPHATLNHHAIFRSDMCGLNNRSLKNQFNFPPWITIIHAGMN